MCSLRDCYFEGVRGEAAIIAEHPEQPSTIQLEISRCYMGGGGDASILWMRGRAAYALWFCGNMAQTAHPLLRIDTYLAGPVICLGNTNAGTGLVVGGTHPNVVGNEATIYVSSAYLAGEYPDPGYWLRAGVGLGTLQP